MVACTHGGFFHSNFAQRAKKIFFHSVTRCTARGYRRILASSANDGEMFRQVVPEERVRVIENGVDIDKFADASSPTLQPTLIYVGRWVAHKGLPRTFDLLAALRGIDPSWRLIVAGREYDLDRNALALLAQEKGVSAAVTLLPNPDNEAIRAAMGEASYSVCLSSHEGFGLAAIEALSAGLVPVLSAIPPFERLAAETGMPLIVPEDPHEAAALLMQRHGELQQCRHVVVRARAQLAVQPYSWSKVVGDYVEEYERAIYEEGHEERAAA